MIALIGLIMFIVSSYLALSKKMHLMVPFIVVPVIAGLTWPVSSLKLIPSSSPSFPSCPVSYSTPWAFCCAWLLVLRNTSCRYKFMLLHFT